MKHNKITISILMIFVILLSVGCSNNQENISDGNENVNADYDFLFQELEEKYEFMHLIQKLIKKFLIMQMKDLHTVQHIKL